jgi:hypothetical protein
MRNQLRSAVEYIHFPKPFAAMLVNVPLIVAPLEANVSVVTATLLATVIVSPFFAVVVGGK